jgi:hypothetical protein
VLDPESQREFVDPSGRRRRVLRAIVIAGGIVTVGYLSVVLLAVLGAPLTPVINLPPPRVDPGGTTASTTAPTGASELTDLFGPLDNGEPGASSQPRSATKTATVRNPPAPTPTATTDRSRPTGPPGQGKPPTTPPGHG